MPIRCSSCPTTDLSLHCYTAFGNATHESMRMVCICRFTANPFDGVPISLPLSRWSLWGIVGQVETLVSREDWIPVLVPSHLVLHGSVMRHVSLSGLQVCAPSPSESVSPSQSASQSLSPSQSPSLSPSPSPSTE